MNKNMKPVSDGVLSGNHLVTESKEGYDMDKTDYMSAFFGNGSVGVIGCSARVYESLESVNETFLSEMTDAVLEYAMMEAEGIDNRFARFSTCLGNLMFYTKRAENGELYTNIMFSDEVLF